MHGAVLRSVALLLVLPAVLSGTFSRSNAGLSDVTGNIAAFGDFNADKQYDELSLFFDFFLSVVSSLIAVLF